MNYSNVKEGLSKYDEVQVGVYLNYLQFLQNEKKDNQPKNKWFPYFKDQQAIDIYKKVALDNLFIDGESITIGFRGKILVTYDFNAYKNRMLNAYPESLIDLQLVCKDDTFAFRKVSGKVSYEHEIKNPFADKLEIIGAYCVIKNLRGQFLETINLEEVNKMKNVAKTQKIWSVWFGEMVKKSVIKRACKTHFKDKFENIERIDNENYDLENVGLSAEISKEIEECETLEELQGCYAKHIKAVKEAEVELPFLKVMGERKLELKKAVKDGEV